MTSNRLPHGFWSQHRVRRLRRLAGTMPAADIAVQFGCTVRQLRHRIHYQKRRYGVGISLQFPPAQKNNLKIPSVGLNETQIREVIAMAGKVPVAEIAQKLGYSKFTVYKIAAELKAHHGIYISLTVQGENHPRAKYSDHTVKTARHLRANSTMSFREIAKKLGVSFQSVREWCEGRSRRATA